MKKWLVLLLLPFSLFFCVGPSLDSDEDLIKSLNQHSKELEPIARLIWEQGNAGVVDIRDGVWSTDIGPNMRIEPEALKSQLSKAQLEILEDAGVRIAHSHSLYGGVLFVTKEGGISISGSVSGFIWKGKEFNPDFIVSDLNKVVKSKKGTEAARENYWLIRPVNDKWGIFFESH